ncbi:MAG: RluA family pseudouridine synthase [Chthoniobacterales bacterium]
MLKPTTIEKPAELLPFLFASMPDVKKSKVRTWLKFQAVTVNGRAITQFNHPLVPGDVVAIRSGKNAASKSAPGGGMRIWHEDSHLIVIEKPADLLSIASPDEPEKTAYFQLTDYLRQGRPEGRERVWIVHRLDKETSGLMVFAKTPEVKEALQSGWDDVEKRYEAVVDGHLREPKGTFECHLDERNRFKVFVAPRSELTRHAVTHYRVLGETRSRSLVELTLETGRRHQIRVQLAHAGCPIIGDEKYDAKSNPAKRLGLHATFLRFIHPATNEEMSFTSPLPKSLAGIVPLVSKPARNPPPD